MAGSSAKRSAAERRRAYQVFGAVWLALQLAYFGARYLALARPVASFGGALCLLLLELTFAATIVARAGDLGDNCREWGLDHFALAALAQLLHLWLHSAWVWLLLLALPARALYELRAVFSSPLLAAAMGAAREAAGGSRKGVAAGGDDDGDGEDDKRPMGATDKARAKKARQQERMQKLSGGKLAGGRR